MKRLILIAACCLAALSTEARGAAAELSLEDAMVRLLSYGIINETPTDASDDSVEILRHYAKLVNQDEEIGDFPYCVRLIEAGGMDNKLPVSCLRAFVKAGARIQGEYGDTSPLQAAAEAGNVKVVEYLVNEGADVHYLDAALKTAMDYAISREMEPAHYEVVRLLLKYRALPSSEAMKHAARFDTPLLREFINYGARMTPEVVNAAVWNADSLACLLEKGASLYGMEENGHNVTRALLQRISLGKCGVEELTRILDMLELHHAPFYTRTPREELELFVPDELPAELRERVLSLYTTMPLPAFADDDDSDVAEVEE